MRHPWIELEIDDGVMQLARQFADLVIQTTVAHLVDIVDQLYRFAKIAVFQAVHQLARVNFQGRLDVTLSAVIVFHSALAADISR
ncbi:hypothetical protein D9M68_806150 [compost metagenome]